MLAALLRRRSAAFKAAFFFFSSEEAVRSKTTDAGSSLSACAVIALGGEKGADSPPQGFVHVGAETFCGAPLHRLQAC